MSVRCKCARHTVLGGGSAGGTRSVSRRDLLPLLLPCFPPPPAPPPPPPPPHNRVSKNSPSFPLFTARWRRGRISFLLSQAAKSSQGGEKVCVLSLWVGDGVFFVLASRPPPPKSSWSRAQIVSEFAKADPPHICTYSTERICMPFPSSLPFREVDVYPPPGESLGDAREGREGRETAFALNAYEEARGDSFFAIWEVWGGPCVPPCLLLLRS